MSECINHTATKQQAIVYVNHLPIQAYIFLFRRFNTTCPYCHKIFLTANMEERDEGEEACTVAPGHEQSETNRRDQEGSLEGPGAATELNREDPGDASTGRGVQEAHSQVWKLTRKGNQ